MEHSDGSEAVNDWENIQPPYSAITAQWEDDNVVAVRDDSSDIPPSNQEVLPATPATSSSHPSSTGEEREGELEVGPRVTARSGILRPEIIGLAYGIIRRYAVCPAGFLSVTGVVAVVLAAAYGRRWLRLRRQVDRDSKEHLIHLIRQKDQKINQLLFQIARMNQFLSASRRVRILRVVVDSSHNVTPPF